MDENGDLRMVNGRMFYFREDDKYVLHHYFGPGWVATIRDKCQDPEGGNCKFHRMNAYQDNGKTLCPLDKMIGDDRWFAYNAGPYSRGKFVWDDDMQLTCEDDLDECSSDDTNQCPDNADCSNTHGGYDCTCRDGETCVDFDQCAPNGGGVCPVGSTCTETSELTDTNKAGFKLFCSHCFH